MDTKPTTPGAGPDAAGNRRRGGEVQSQAQTAHDIAETEEGL